MEKESRSKRARDQEDVTQLRLRLCKVFQIN